VIRFTALDRFPALLARFAPSRWPQALALLLGLALALGFYRGFANAGEFSDEGSFCTIGQGLLAGQLPYRDYFNEKPPLQYLWTATAMHFGGTGIAGARLASTITLFFTLALLLFEIARRTRPLPALLFSVAMLTACGVLMQVYNDTAESSLALLFAACALLLSDDGNAGGMRRRGVFLGLLLGLACGFRITAVLPALVLLASPWLRGARASFSAGFTVGVALWVSWLASLGILDEALSAVLFFHWGNAGVGSYFRGVASETLPAVAAWLLVLVVSCHAARERRLWLLLLAITAAAPFFGRMDAFRLWPSTILLLAMLWKQDAQNPSRMHWQLALPIVLLGWLGFPAPGSFAPTKQIVAGIARHSAAGERIWVAPFAPSVYCLSGRASASRFYFVLPWVAKPSVRAEVMRDLRARPPTLIVEVTNSGYSLDALVPAARPWLQQDYVLAETSADTRFWRLKPVVGNPVVNPAQGALAHDSTAPSATPTTTASPARGKRGELGDNPGLRRASGDNRG